MIVRLQDLSASGFCPSWKLIIRHLWPALILPRENRDSTHPSLIALLSSTSESPTMVRNPPLWETTMGMPWSIPNKIPYGRVALYPSDIRDVSVSKLTNIGRG